MLDETFLDEFSRNLGIKFQKLPGEKTTRFKYYLEGANHLIITPVDKGPKGYSEWFTWHLPPHDHEADDIACPMPEPTIRAYVQVFIANNGNHKEIASFTLHHENLESLLKTALEIVQKETGHRLSPVRLHRTQ